MIDTMLSPEVIADLSPKIRTLVVLLNAWGFPTTDSGDGSNFADGMECAVEVPMIYVSSTRDSFVSDSERIMTRLRQTVRDTAPLHIEATYSPTDGVAGVLITGITDDDLIDGIKFVSNVPTNTVSYFIMQFFAYEHLPKHLQEVSEPFYLLAHKLCEMPYNPELEHALRRLLESKDAAVRARLAR